MRPYAPSNDDPAQFIATPVIHNDEVCAILAFQIPLDEINAIMQERTGMGESGETYLVGSDLLMRSDSYLAPESHSVEVSLNGTVAANGVDTEAARTGLSGEADNRVILDYRGTPVFSSWGPVEVGDLRWS